MSGLLEDLTVHIPTELRRLIIAYVAPEFVYMFGGAEPVVKYGDDQPRTLSFPTCWDEATNSTIKLDRMIYNRRDAGITLHNRKIFVTGGVSCTALGHGTRHDSVEIYDLDKNEWMSNPFIRSRTSNVARLPKPPITGINKSPHLMTVPRSAHTASTVGDSVFVVGGTVNGVDFWTRCEVYNYRSKDEWNAKVISDIPHGRSLHGAAVVQGRLYLLGGIGTSGMVEAIDCYDPPANSWKTVGRMSRARYQFGTAVIGNKIYIVGGSHEVVTPHEWYRGSASVDCYDPITNTWKAIKSCLNKRLGCALVVSGGSLIAIGGVNDLGFVKTVERFDPRFDSGWSSIGSLPSSGCGMAQSAVVAPGLDTSNTVLTKTSVKAATRTKDASAANEDRGNKVKKDYKMKRDVFDARDKADGYNSDDYC